MDYAEIDSRFLSSEMKTVFGNLRDRGFQEWPQAILLTRTKFDIESAKFVTVETTTPEIEENKVRDMVSRESDVVYEIRSVVEVFDQRQKRLHIFLRDKYGESALRELAEKVKQSRFYKEKEDNYLNWLIESLEKGDVVKARVDFEQQGDKFEKEAEMEKMIIESLYDDNHMHPKDRWKKLMKEESV